MSRAQKQQRRKRRHERKLHSAPRKRFDPLFPLAARRSDPDLQLLSYDIVYDSIEDPALEMARIEELLGGEPSADERLLEQIHKDPQAAFPFSIACTSKCPIPRW